MSRTGIYASAKGAILGQTLSLLAAGIKAMTLGAYTPDFANHVTLTDVPSGARLSAGVALANKTLVQAGTGYKFDADDVAFSGLANPSVVAGVLLYLDGGSDASSKLIGYFDYFAGVPVTVTSGTVTFAWPSAGIFLLDDGVLGGPQGVPGSLLSIPDPVNGVLAKLTDTTVRTSSRIKVSADGFLEIRGSTESVATSGMLRLGYNPGVPVISALDSGGVTRALLTLDPLGVGGPLFGHRSLGTLEFLGSGLVFNGGSGSSQTQIVMNAGEITFQVSNNPQQFQLDALAFSFGLPRVGLNTAWGASEGTVTITNTGAHTLTSSEFSVASQKYTGAGTATMTYPAATALQTYFKWVEETGGSDKVITTGAGVTYTLVANTAAYLKFDNTGVKSITTGAGGGGAASLGASGQINVSNGSGGWLAPTNMFGGSSWIGAGVSTAPTTNGFVTANAFAYTTKDASGTEANIAKMDGSGNLFFGQTGAGQTSMNLQAATGTSMNVNVGGTVRFWVGDSEIQCKTPVTVPSTSNYIDFFTSGSTSGMIRVAGGADRNIIVVRHSGVDHAVVRYESGAANIRLGATTNALSTAINQGAVTYLGATGTSTTAFQTGSVDINVPQRLGAFGGVYASLGLIKISNNAGTVLAARDSTNANDQVVAYTTVTDLWLGSAVGGSSQFNNTFLDANTKVSLVVNGTDTIEVTNASILSSQPRMGLGSPFASEGHASVTTALSSYTLSSSEYSRQSVYLGGNGTSSTFIFPGVGDANHTYFKCIETDTVNSSGNITISNGGANTITHNQTGSGANHKHRAWFEFNTAGVVQITAWFESPNGV